MKKVVVDKAKCIGCGLCITLADKVFKMDEESGKAVVYGDCAFLFDCEAKVKEAIDSCPLTAIFLKEENINISNNTKKSE